MLGGGGGGGEMAEGRGAVRGGGGGEKRTGTEGAEDLSRGGGEWG